MSQSSPPSAEAVQKTLQDCVLKFEVKKARFFDVEFANRGEDIIYHFWPQNDGQWFLPGQDPSVFAMALEEGFKNTLPSTADVRAEYTDPKESLVLLRFGENPDSEAKPRETYFVRVVGYANQPMADRFLKEKVFEAIDLAVHRRTTCSSPSV